MSGRYSFQTPEQYLAHHHVLVYIEDAVTQLLIHKDENPKVEPARFFSDYFTCVRQGSHTLLRDFAFVMATPRNRSSFIRTFYRCYGSIGKKGDLMRTKEYHALVSLICNNFPYDLVQRAERVILIDDATDCLILFSDFIYAFQAQLYYYEFIEKSFETYQLLIQQSHRSPRDAVVIVPSTMEALAGTGTGGTSTTAARHIVHGLAATDSVEASAYLKSLLTLADKPTYSVPPPEAIQDILGSTNRVTFYEFLVAMSKSEKINCAIGALPSATDLYKDIEIYEPAPIPANEVGTAAAQHQAGSSDAASTKAGTSTAAGPVHRPASSSKRVVKKALVTRRAVRSKEASSNSSDDSKSDSDDSSGA